MTLEIHSPSETPDGKVRRSRTGRPYVKQPCPDRYLIDNLDKVTDDEGGLLPFPGNCVDGRIPGKTSKGKQCPRCKGKGWIEKLYSRCTSFVSVLESTKQLEMWRQRVTLVGLGVDHGLLQALAAADPDDRETLDSLADKAFEVGEGHAKAQKGTDLHKLTEYVDLGEPLPAELPRFDDQGNLIGYTPVTLQDRADLAAWDRTIKELGMSFPYPGGIECFVVQDDYEIGGTYDRRAIQVAHAPICECRRPMILDLKTGRIDYGAGKIAQQLAVYAHSRDYDPATGERADQDVCQHVGIVVHLPQGTGEATVHVVDLVAGWSAVELSSKVREHRRMAKEMIWPLETHAENVG